MEARQQLIPASPSSVKPVRELALSAAWHGGLTRSLVDIEGRTINVVFPGNWSHGHGPDFQNAMVEIPDRGLVTGSIELHHQASDWLNHGHHLDARYTDVILHVVSRCDLVETRALDHRSIPMAVLTIPDEMLFRIDARLPEIWSELGGDVCAESTVANDQSIIRDDILRLGDWRLHDRVVRIEGDLQVEPARDLMTQMLFDALGYTENRQPMQAVARLLNQITWVDRFRGVPETERDLEAQALTFGLAGYLPFSPVDANLAGIASDRMIAIELRWQTISPSLGCQSLVPTNWVRARTRPANHPASRLALGSRLLASFSTDPVGELLDAIGRGDNLIDWLQVRGIVEGRQLLGGSRARTIVANVLLPLAIAIAHHRGDDFLEEAASSAWNELPIAEWTRPAKRALHQVAGQHPLTRLGERGHQGLLKLDRDFCTPRKCFECPIAASVFRESLTSRRH